MKKILYILTAIAVVFLYACEPQMDVAPEIGAAPKGDFTIDNSNPNNIVLTVNATDAFMYTWDLGNGEKAEGKVVTAYYAFKGDYTAKCTISGKGGAIVSQKTISVSATDPQVSEKPIVKELTGSGAGKTWVYADDNPDGLGYCYMVASYDWDEYWWNPYDGGASPDFGSELVFDLDGAYNFTGVDGNVGSFSINADANTIQFIDANILDWDEENCNPDMTATGLYNITKITDDELVLVQHQFDDDYAWTWRFKRKGYVYP